MGRDYRMKFVVRVDTHGVDYLLRSKNPRFRDLLEIEGTRGDCPLNRVSFLSLRTKGNTVF